MLTLAFAPSDAMILSNDFGAPPSTSTKPSPVKNARTLLPPPSTTVIWSVRRRTPPNACCALRTRADVHDSERAKSALQHISAIQRSVITFRASAIVPVLSPNLSRSTPTF